MARLQIPAERRPVHRSQGVKTVKNIMVQRITSVRTTPEIAWDNVQDYCHFVYLHRKHFSRFQVLHDDGTTQVFYYASRILPPFPFSSEYLAVRVMDHADRSFRQIYEGLTWGDRLYFHCRVVPKDERVEIHNRYLCQVSGVWQFFPKLFAWVVNRRMQAMWLEDRQILAGRFERGGFSNERCAPQVRSLARELAENFDRLIGQFEGPDVSVNQFVELEE